MAGEEQLGTGLVANGGLPWGGWLSSLYADPNSAVRPSEVNPSPPPQPWQGQSPRVRPAPRDNVEAFADTLADLSRQPQARATALDTLNRGAQWLVDKVGPAIPPELRGKMQAVGELIYGANPATLPNRFTGAVERKDYPGAALEMFSAVPSEAVAAGIGKAAAAATMIRPSGVNPNRMVTYASGKP